MYKNGQNTGNITRAKIIETVLFDKNSINIPSDTARNEENKINRFFRIETSMITRKEATKTPLLYGRTTYCCYWITFIRIVARKVL